MWRIKSTIKSKQFKSSRLVSSALKAKGIDVSSSSVKQAVHSMHLTARWVRRKPRLTESQKSARCQFARKHLNYTWDRVLFSDEKTWQTFMLPGGKNYMVRTDDPNDPSLFAETVKRPAKMQVWGGVTYWGKLPLHFFEEELG
jgi:hypothetical protein